MPTPLHRFAFGGSDIVQDPDEGTGLLHRHAVEALNWFDDAGAVTGKRSG